MIKIKVLETKFEHILKPTIFPDKTSQVWQLPEELINCGDVSVTWNFEEEREIIDLISLSNLVNIYDLHIPYLPYSRQDKSISNDRTFNYFIFLDMLNLVDRWETTTIDVHNPDVLINSITNLDVRSFHKHVFQTVQPTYIVFPDEGAAKRYPYLKKNPHIVFHKTRDQSTGQITGHHTKEAPILKGGETFLLVDDLIDGGATFISISKILHETAENIKVNLCVTHGLFSKGRQILHDAGIDKIFTTNSLIKNNGQENVFEV